MNTNTRARATLLTPDAGETLQVVTDHVRVLADAAVSGGGLSIFEITAEPGSGPPLHSHQLEDEYFYIISGRAKFTLDGKSFVGEPGAFVCAPRGSVHTFVSSGKQPLRMIVIVSPSGIEVPFRETSKLLKTNPSAGPAALAAIFATREIAFLGPPLSPD